MSPGDINAAPPGWFDAKTKGVNPNGGPSGYKGGGPGKGHIGPPTLPTLWGLKSEPPPPGSLPDAHLLLMDSISSPSRLSHHTCPLSVPPLELFENLHSWFVPLGHCTDWSLCTKYPSHSLPNKFLLILQYPSRRSPPHGNIPLWAPMSPWASPIIGLPILIRNYP